MREMKKPSKSVRKWAEKIHTEKRTMSWPAGSSMMTKLVRPNSGSKIMAAFTAFLKTHSHWELATEAVKWPLRCFWAVIVIRMVTASAIRIGIVSVTTMVTVSVTPMVTANVTPMAIVSAATMVSVSVTPTVTVSVTPMITLSVTPMITVRATTTVTRIVTVSVTCIYFSEDGGRVFEPKSVCKRCFVHWTAVLPRPSATRQQQ